MTAGDQEALIARLERRLARERQAREEAERIAERTTRELYNRVQELEAARAESSRAAEELVRVSTPVLPIARGVIGIPIIGRLNERRRERVRNIVLDAAARLEPRVVILELSGALLTTPEDALHIAALTRGIKLLGVFAMLAAVRPELAEALADARLPSHVRSFAGLAQAIAAADALVRVGG